LHLAALHGAAEASALLLAHKANPNATMVPPDSSQRIPMLPPFSMSGNTPLHLAAINGRTNVVQILLKARAAINATNSNGRTALDLATRPAYRRRIHSAESFD